MFRGSFFGLRPVGAGRAHAAEPHLSQRRTPEGVPVRPPVHQKRKESQL